ncbi:MAG: nuclear transport factor 2 family protein [Sphingopyxis sp.]|uniref:nuclear transport factor 2 family protein n=1 Tax=Sphingopyxis sp. TaxID=1908224 RepID=UPI002ABBFD74|nr:nuclear transport factor 2 family protein [Sphingopyxis sp.]MDZ3830880.1 nuclear transport factor 2 family protein [Sphingopyxis sp.]
MGFDGPCEDRLALRDLLDSYADAVCRHDAADWGATWHPDGEWLLPGFGHFVGRAAIVTTWQSAMKNFSGIVFQAWPGSMHVDGDYATMRSYTAENYVRDGRMHRDLGSYDDRCIRHDRRWLFTRRAFTPLQRWPARG